MTVSSAQPDLSLIIPFYNEEQSVAVVVAEVRTALEEADIIYELILIENGSWDGTRQQLLSVQNDRCIHVVLLDNNQGYGGAILTGLGQARGRFVGYMAGDGQIEPRDVVRVFGYAQQHGVAMAKLSRTVREDGLLRCVTSVVYNWLFRLMFRINVMDVNGSPKVLPRQVFAQLSPVSRDWFLDAELVLRVSRCGWRIVEVPGRFRKRVTGHSHVRLSAVLEFLRNIVQWRVRFRHGVGVEIRR